MDVRDNCRIKSGNGHETEQLAPSRRLQKASAPHRAFYQLIEQRRGAIDVTLGAGSSWGHVMFKAAMAIASVAGILVSCATAVSAQSTPRSECCKQLNGRWEAASRTGEMRCFGVETNRYYQCVSKRSAR